MVTVIIAAAGQGKRMGCEKNKILLPIGGESIIARTIRQITACPEVDEIVLVAAAGEEGQLAEIAATAVGKTALQGGGRRQRTPRFDC